MKCHTNFTPIKTFLKYKIPGSRNSKNTFRLKKGTQENIIPSRTCEIIALQLNTRGQFFNCLQRVIIITF